MSNEKFELKEGQGTLWTDGLECIGRGVVKKNGNDVRVAIIRSQDKDGKPRFEVFESDGLLYFNPPSDKNSENSPDYSSKVKLSGDKVKFSSWENVSQRGTKYLSVKIKPVEEGDVPF